MVFDIPYEIAIKGKEAVDHYTETKLEIKRLEKEIDRIRKEAIKYAETLYNSTNQHPFGDKYSGFNRGLMIDWYAQKLFRTLHMIKDNADIFLDSIVEIIDIQYRIKDLEEKIKLK